MAIRKAQAEWKGSLKEGSGVMKFPGYTGAFTWSSRFEEAAGTNPESLLGAAHAGCYSMALTSDLGKAGFPPASVSTEATVTLGRVEGKARILTIHLETLAAVPGISNLALTSFFAHRSVRKPPRGAPMTAIISIMEVRELAWAMSMPANLLK